MNRRTFRVATLSAALVTGIAAFYGGWATVTIENLPDQLTVGQPYNLTFSIRQHGDRLIEDLSPRVELQSGKRDVVARAVATNRPGYYTATVNVPTPGEWQATVQTNFGKSHLELMPITAVRRGARAVSLTEPERGQRLFVAKGCASCHQHARVARSGTFNVGPDLTTRRFTGDYLNKFLDDPSIKPPTTEARMPDLNLQPREIAALSAFLMESAARAAAR